MTDEEKVGVFIWMLVLAVFFMVIGGILFHNRVIDKEIDQEHKVVTEIGYDRITRRPCIRTILDVPVEVPVTQNDWSCYGEWGELGWWWEPVRLEELQ